MAVIKSITVSEDLYALWLDFHRQHVDMTFNQLVREAIEHYLAQAERHAVSAGQK